MFRGGSSARRWTLGVALSFAVHAVVVGGWAAILILRGLTLDGGRVDVEITGMRLDEIHDLPLGAPAAASQGPRARPKARRRAPKPPPEAAGQLAVPPATAKPEAEERPGFVEGDDDAEGNPAPPTKLGEYGPEGSRLTVLLRLDRLRETPYVQAVDTILQHMPDRQRLLQGTGLDLYQVFDALLIATPNPLDASATFLAGRHHLSDDNMRAVLEAGARETGHVLTWRTERHRPVAERRAPNASPGQSRDDRLIILPAPGLVVVAPPVYRSLLLKPGPPRAAAAPDGGVAGGDGAADAGVGEARAGWSELLGRIDAEGGIMPPDAIAMLSSVDLFSARSLQRGLDAMPGRRGAARDGGARAGASATASSGMFMGMEVPRVLTVVTGSQPSPFLDVTAELADEDEARHWETSWPSIHQKLRLNPYVVLSGFSALVARAELTRDGSTIHLHQTATDLETMRLLELIGRLLSGSR